MLCNVDVMLMAWWVHDDTLTAVYITCNRHDMTKCTHATVLF